MNIFSSQIAYDVYKFEENPWFKSVRTLKFNQNNLKTSVYFTHMRSALGWNHFPSYHFNMLKKSDEISFFGYGWGHHVGMSQWGAFMMANNFEKNYLDILHHYYADVTIDKL